MYTSMLDMCFEWTTTAANSAFIFELQTLFYSQAFGHEMSQGGHWYVIAMMDKNMSHPTKENFSV